MKITRRSVLASIAALFLMRSAEAQVIAKIHAVFYNGEWFSFDREMVVHKDDTWKVYSRIKMERPTILDANSFCPIVPTTPIKVKYNVGVDSKGKFQPMPCMVMRNQQFEVDCYEFQYDGRANQRPASIRYMYST